MVALWVWKRDFYLGIGLRIIRSSAEKTLNSDSPHLEPMISPAYLPWQCTSAIWWCQFIGKLVLYFFFISYPLFAALNKLLCCSQGNCTFWTCFRYIHVSWEPVTWQLYRNLIFLYVLCHQIVSPLPLFHAGVMNFRFTKSIKQG